MSKATKLSDYPLVTSLGSSDTIIATDSAGAVKRIARDNLVALTKKRGATGAQWIRLFEFSSSYVLFQIASNYYSNPGNSILAHAILQRESISFNKIEILSHLKHNVNDVFSKMRVVLKNNSVPAYLDVYYNSTGYNDIWLTIFPGVSMPTPMLENNAVIPEGYSTKEFDMTVRGGVKRCFTARWKGGAQHEQSHRPFQRPPQRRDDRRTRLPRIMYRLRHRLEAGILQGSAANGDNKLSSRCIPMGDTGSIGGSGVCVATLHASSIRLLKSTLLSDEFTRCLESLDPDFRSGTDILTGKGVAA